MSLVDDWRRVQEGLPDGWTSVSLVLEVGGTTTTAPPRCSGRRSRTARSRARSGSTPSTTGRARPRPRSSACSRASTPPGSPGRSARSRRSRRAAAATPAPEATLAEAWAAELAKLPSDWSDVFGEVDLISSDYLEAAALQLVPINPRPRADGDDVPLPLRGPVRLRRLARDGRALPRALRREGHPRHGHRAAGALGHAARRHAGPGLARRRAHRLTQVLDATALADAVRRREVEPSELVEEAFARLEAVEPRLNAFVTTCYEEALAAARGPLPDGPFRGVPIAIKDLTETAGIRTTYSCRAFAENVPAADAAVVRRLREAGFVLVGKTNTPELGTTAVTESALNGACRNPWDLERTPGGSSGGAAAHVAAGVLPLAHGSDGGGSIRIPASCCGLFGLKPSRGRVSAAPHGDGAFPLGQNGPLAWTVRDAAAFLDVVAGPEPGDLHRIAPPERPFAEEVGAEPGRLRIAVTVEPPLPYSGRGAVRGRGARRRRPARGARPRRRRGHAAVARRGAARPLRRPLADGARAVRRPPRPARAAEPRARGGGRGHARARVRARGARAAAVRAAGGRVLGGRGRRPDADAREAAGADRVGAPARPTRGSSTGARPSSRRSRRSRT